MDVETAEAIDILRTDIGRVEKALTGRIGGIENSLTARIDIVESSLSTRIDSVERSLTATMRELNEDAKRHADVKFESLQHSIQMLADGFASLSEKVDSRRR